MRTSTGKSYNMHAVDINSEPVPCDFCRRVEVITSLYKLMCKVATGIGSHHEQGTFREQQTY